MRHLLQQLSSPSRESASTGQQEGGGKQGLILALVIPCGLVVVVCLAAVWLLIWRRRSAQSHPSLGHTPTWTGHTSPHMTININADASTKDELTFQSKNKGQNGSLDPASFSTCSINSNLLSTGWTVVSCASNAKHLEQFADDDTITLGVLLGAGSSARVYRGRWRGEDVAVKVLRHTASTAAAVANETALIMKLDHPNIVQACHVVTWCQNNGTASSSSFSSTSNTGYLSSSNINNNMSSSSNSNNALSQHGNTSTSNNSSNSSHSHAVPATASSPSTFNAKVQPHIVHQSQPPQSHDSSTDMGALSSSSNAFSKHMPELPGIAEDSVVCHGRPEDRDSCKASAKSYEPFAWLRHAPDGYGHEDQLPCTKADVAQTWLVQELCDGGSLHDAVRAGRFLGSDGKVDRVKVLCALHDVAQGMCYVHSCRVIHRDLKASNVLLVTDPLAPFGITCKLCDFGLSCMMYQDRSYWSTLTLGTVSHMSPELLRAGRQSRSADVYAFAIVMWEVAAGVSAFAGVHHIEVISRVALRGERPKLPAHVAKAMGLEFVALMEACWDGTASKRPRFEQVMQRLRAMLLAAAVVPREAVGAAAGGGGGAGGDGAGGRHARFEGGDALDNSYNGEFELK